MKYKFSKLILQQSKLSENKIQKYIYVQRRKISSIVWNCEKKASRLTISWSSKRLSKHAEIFWHKLSWLYRLHFCDGITWRYIAIAKNVFVKQKNLRKVLFRYILEDYKCWKELIDLTKESPNIKSRNKYFIYTLIWAWQNAPKLNQFKTKECFMTPLS